MKTTLGVIWGGRSVEHEVSIITAQQLLKNIDRDKYRVVPVYISKEGVWYSGEELLRLETFRNPSALPAGLTRVCLPPYPARHNLIGADKKGLFKKGFQEHLDVVIPAIHGSHGEDGTLQGLLELADIPYTGAGVLGSALGMDKISMKAALKEEGVPVVDYRWFPRRQWEKEAEKLLDMLEKELTYPMFVKPADLGSSIGVKRVADRDELCFALDVAGSYSRRLLVEKALTGCTEINCAVLGDSVDCRPSVCEQPIAWQEFLTYEDKYMRGGNQQGMVGTKRKIPAPISGELTARIQELACRAFKALAGRGVARIDFLVGPDNGQAFVNEINTIPGSFAYYLWEAAGIGYPELIDRLIELALDNHRVKSQTTYSVANNLLGQGSKFSGK